MNAITSFLGTALSLLGILAFTLLAGLFVLMYVLIAAVAVTVRWCVDVARRAGARRSRPRTPTPVR
ncbi:hypothetical protein [Microbacterium lushaniae]|uniref:Uncharacterized protein n=1 Tax=Microbacterium lushaniae TaxID=2614639 RepID=A0A5J6L6V8_9MICO|nr:hypothetical protein [Microbacterium lushaniae]QEW04244.1 hypothetical protein F6J85_14875 [Microbacterium lushaniae]